MIALAFGLALLTQQMNQEDLISEGEQIGRAATAMGTCQAVGYPVDELAGARWADAYMTRAAESGWAVEVADNAVDAGSAAEALRLAVPQYDPSLTPSQLHGLATDFITKVKARCRRLSAEVPGMIRDVDQGDRNADAQLAIMLRGL